MVLFFFNNFNFTDYGSMRDPRCPLRVEEYAAGVCMLAGQDPAGISITVVSYRAFGSHSIGCHAHLHLRPGM